MIPFDIAQYQPKAWRLLSRSFLAGRTASTYLFHGKEGVGKWATAVSFAALLNCEQPVKSNDDGIPVRPCGECRACRTIFALNYEGLHFAVPVPPHKNLGEAIEQTSEYLAEKRAEPFRILSFASHTAIPIDVAREIRRRLSLRGAEGMTRVVLFYQMERMLPSSADALLKLIEEPPSDTVIILTAQRPESLLPTIQSRAHKVRFHNIPEENIITYLRERHDVGEKRATLLARLADGSLGTAMAMLEMPEDESSQRAVAQLLFKSLLTEPPYETVARLTDLIGGRDRGQAERLLEVWQSLVRDCTFYAVTQDETKVVNVDFLAEITKLCGAFAERQLPEVFLDNIKIALADLRRNVHIHGTLTALILRIRSQMPTQP